MAVPKIILLGAEETRLSYRRGAAAAIRTKPAMSRVADDVMRIIRIQFESQGRRGGGSWAKLKPATVKAKLRDRKDPRTMIASGKLMNSLTKRRSRNMDLVINDDVVRLASRLPYADRLARGDEAAGIPARPIITILPSDEARWADEVRNHVLRRMHPR